MERVIHPDGDILEKCDVGNGKREQTHIVTFPIPPPNSLELMATVPSVARTIGPPMGTYLTPTRRASLLRCVP